MILFDELKRRPVLLYGAGAIARIILPYLLCNEEIHLLGVAVSQDAQNADLGTRGVCVQLIQKYESYAEEVVVLIATSEQYHEDICRNCSKWGFSHVVPLTPELKDEIICSYYQVFFSEKGISLNKSSFCLGNMRFLNPFQQSIPNGANLFSQLGDLVLPHEYDEWRMVVEGPYDWKRVSLASDDVVLDCGANMGVFSVYAASRGCTVYAFEPAPALHSVLGQHAELNGGRIFLETYAVSDQAGMTTFHLDPYSCGGSSLVGSFS